MAERTFIRRSLVSTVLAGSLIALAAPVYSNPASEKPVSAQDPAARQAHVRERVQAGLRRLAERLQLDASQQGAWSAYTKTVEGMMGGSWTQPPADADAAALMRFRAQRAAEHAQKLMQLADATASLQQALNPEQRKVLDEMVRRPAHMRQHARRHAHGKHAPSE